jgi:hypothetical protein
VHVARPRRGSPRGAAREQVHSSAKSAEQLVEPADARRERRLARRTVQRNDFL